MSRSQPLGVQAVDQATDCPRLTTKIVLHRKFDLHTSGQIVLQLPVPVQLLGCDGRAQTLLL